MIRDDHNVKQVPEVQSRPDDAAEGSFFSGPYGVTPTNSNTSNERTLAHLIEAARLSLVSCHFLYF